MELNPESSQRLECLAQCRVDTNQEPEFKKDDIFFSNQIDAGASVWHAIGKAMQSKIIQYTNGKYKFDSEELVKFLENSVDKGFWPSDYHEVKGFVVGEGGHRFELQIYVLKIHMQYADFAPIFVIEPAKLWENYKDDKDAKLAVYNI